MQDDVAPAVAPPQTPESLPVDPRHNKAPKTPTSLDDLSSEDIAAALDRNLMENLGENEEKDSDIDSDSDSDEETCAEASKKTMTLETVMKLIKKEPTEEPKVASAKKKEKNQQAQANSRLRAKKRTRIQMIQDLTVEEPPEEIVAPVPTNKDAGICQVLESLV